LEGEGWTLWGNLQGSKTVGASASGLIRVERLRLADTGGANHLRMQLKSALYLGERWEYQLQLGNLRIRMWGETARPAGEHWVAVPEDSLWIF
jgi:iron(III) transport system ATP-binding protein